MQKQAPAIEALLNIQRTFMLEIASLHETVAQATDAVKQLQADKANLAKELADVRAQLAAVEARPAKAKA